MVGLNQLMGYEPSSPFFDINLIGSPTAIQILTNDQNKNAQQHVELKIQALAWDRHTNVAVLIQLMGSEPSPFCLILI